MEGNRFPFAEFEEREGEEEQQQNHREEEDVEEPFEIDLSDIRFRQFFIDLELLRRMNQGESEEERRNRESLLLTRHLRRMLEEDSQERFLEKFQEEVSKKEYKTSLVDLYEVDFVKSENGSVKFFQQKGDCMGLVMFDFQEFFRQQPSGNQYRETRAGKNFYFEVKVESLECGKNGSKQCLAIGLCHEGMRNDFLGWRNNSIGYHADNGVVYDNFMNWNSKEGRDMKYLVGEYCGGDTVGCGFDISSGEIFFTLNGQKGKFIGKRNFVHGRKYFAAITCISRVSEMDVVFSVNIGDDTAFEPFLYPLYNVSLDCRTIRKYLDVVVYTV